MNLKKIERVSVLLVLGTGLTVATVTEAIDFLKKYSQGKSKLPLAKYEIIIRYNTGDRIEASLKDNEDSIKFLETYL